jgi:hypothetical protein
MKMNYVTMYVCDYVHMCMYEVLMTNQFAVAIVYLMVIDATTPRPILVVMILVWVCAIWLGTPEDPFSVMVGARLVDPPLVVLELVVELELAKSES